ncbi:flagellar basal body rod protein FlgB [Bacillus coahuilensis]|uniref:flagellar basal body rod protein FlgB n=1 Tax=Bacillus coahuilensis TaxID=408580 RepID=UPI000AFA1DDF
MVKLFSATTQSLEAGLNYSADKQKAISQNIANVDTPNYKAKDVKFESYFKKSVADIQANETSDKHMSFKPTSATGTSAAPYNSSDFIYHHNGNGIDVDKEMADLATNQIYYNSLIQQLNHKYSMITTVVKGAK